MGAPNPRVALFVPCYVDQFGPEVAWATLRVLERAGCSVDYDSDQTCCGQPFVNLGLSAAALPLARAHLARFASAEVVVCPSASCVATVRHHYGVLEPGAEEVRARTYELGEFLVHRLGRVELGASFPHRVALLESCHGLRELGLGRPSEAPSGAPAGSTEQLLRAVSGLELVFPERDECCGFGGAFAVEYPEVSARMGRAKLAQLEDTGAEYVTGTDLSCLIHLDGLRRRTGRGPQPVHLAEVLAAEETA